MKLKKLHTLLFSLLISTCMISSCKKPVEPSSSQKIDVITYKLKAEYTGETYNQYDNFAIDGLTISRVKLVNDVESASSKLSPKEYQLSFDDNTILKDGDLLSKTGNFKINVEDLNSTYKSENASFNITCNAITNLQQNLVLNDSRLKTEYSTTDYFDYLDVTAKYIKSFTDSSGKKVNKETELDYKDLDITIDGNDAKDFYFTSTNQKDIKVTVKYTCPNDEEIETSFTIDCTKESAKADDIKMSVTFTNENGKVVNDDDKGYFSPEEVETNTMRDYANVSLEGWRYTPTKGNVNLLVVPIILPGDETTDAEIEYECEIINDAFKSKNEDDGNFSLKSYYLKSSYNQLNFNPVITDVINIKNDLVDYPNYDNYKNISSDAKNISSLVKDASSYAIKNSGYEASYFDSDKDGYIDGIWFMFLNHSQQSTTTLYWAFTSSTSDKSGTIKNPAVNIYGWCGYDFLISKEGKRFDAHTLIHETGHMLGLSDYYSYSYQGYSPLGTIDMMDHNIGDHNMYSKMILGWVKPYIVYGDNVTLELSSSQYKNSFAIFAYDDKKYNKNSDGKIQFNIFDEYFILDYYTPTNLNKDSVNQTSTLTEYGGRLYHIDARLAYFNRSINGNSIYRLFDNPDDILTYTKNNVTRVITNSESGDRSESVRYFLPPSYNAFDEIRWISADGRKLSETTSKRPQELVNPVSVSNIATNASLFKPKSSESSEKDTNVSSFSITSFSNQFNNGKLNSNKTCSYSFTINSIQ